MTDRGSRAWSAVFRIAYVAVGILDPLIRAYLALGGLGLARLVEVRVVGRRTGRVRRVVVTLLTVDGGWYVGHPNGPAAWTRNLAAAGEALLVPLAGRDPDPGVLVRPVPLPPGDERTAVIRATSRQQPFPANALYRAARGHILAVGDYHRLDHVPSRSSSEPLASHAGAAHPEVP